MGLNRILNNKIHDIFEEPETKVRLYKEWIMMKQTGFCRIVAYIPW